MPRDHAGRYALPDGNPVVTGTTITAEWANETMADIAAELENSLSRDGQGGMRVPFQFGDGTEVEPGIAFANEPSTGFYRPFTLDMRATVGGVDRLRITDSRTAPLEAWNEEELRWENLLTNSGDPDIIAPWRKVTDQFNQVTGIAYTGGNVGIGTTDPSAGNALVDIAGYVNLRDDDIIAWGGGTGRVYFRGNKAAHTFELFANNGVTFNSGLTLGGWLRFKNNAGIRQDLANGTDTYLLNRGSDNTIRFFTSNNAQRMVITDAGNVGIGTTDPRSKLHVEGANIGELVPSNCAFRGYINTTGHFGLYLEAAATGTSYLTRMRTNASQTAFEVRSDGQAYFGAGNVGIGTSSPAALLHVNGNLKCTNVLVGSPTGGGNTYGGGDTGGPSHEMYGKDHASYPGSIYYNAQKHIFRYSTSSPFKASTAMFINNNGNVGIGTTSPAHPLDVNGIIGRSGYPYLTAWSGMPTPASAADVGATKAADGGLFPHLRGGCCGGSQVNFATAMSDCASRGVRLPTVEELEANVASGTGGGYDSQICWTCTPVPGKPGYVYGNYGKPNNYASPVESHRVELSTSTGVASVRWVADVVGSRSGNAVFGGSITAAGNISQQGNSFNVGPTGGTSSVVQITMRRSSANWMVAPTSGGYFGWQVNGNTVAMTLTASSNLTVTGNVTAYSDARVKTNVRTIDRALDKICAMRGVTFNRTDLDGKEGSGVIAQELREVAPELVQEDEDGKLSVAYGNLVGYLIEAIKELRALH